MALGIVQAGYKGSLYMYTAGNNPDWENSFEEWLAELTTELELALEGSTEDTVADSEEEMDCAETYSERKKEWEDQLEQATVVEAMLRQALENGLGQQKEEEKPPQKQEEETDNEFFPEGIPMPAEGKSRNNAEPVGEKGNAQFLQTDSEHGAEYLNLANGGRRTLLQQLRTICLTCETDCDRKKQWKIMK